MTVALLWFFAAGATAGEWLKATSDHFSLLTDSSPKRAAATLRRFEEMRLVLVHLSGTNPPSESRLAIVGITGMSESQRFRTGQKEGFYLSGGFGDLILLLGPDVRHTAVHEYVHFFIHQNGLILPAWLEEGLADFYSTVDIGGGSARVGDPLPARLAIVRSGGVTRLPLSKLFAITKDAREYSGADAVSFYSQSWALIHMLEMSEQYKPGLPRFLGELLLGAGTERAFQQAYAKTAAAVENDLLSYVQQQRLPTVIIHLSERFTDPQMSWAAITEPAAALVLADVLAALGKNEEVPKLLSGIAGRYPADPDVETGRGEMAMRDGNDSEAQAHFDRAIEMGSRNAQTYYEYASLVRDKQPARFRSLLERALSLDPLYFNAQYLLGYTDLREGRYEEAIAHLKSAADLSPSRATVWEQLALAYKGQGKADEAVLAARMAVQVSASKSEHEHMMALVQEMRRAVPEPPLVAARPASPTRVTAPREAPLRALRSDASVTGTLVQVDCLGAPARLIIDSEGKRLLLLVRDPGAVLMKGSRSRTLEFQCGPSAPRPVEISYQTRDDPTYRTAGDVTAIEFK